MKKYSKFQFGWIIVLIFLIIIVWITFAYVYQWGNNPINKAAYIIFLLLFGGILLGFYGMTVIVTDRQIIIKFGIGLYIKKIDLSSINSIETVKYPIYYGYGIRIIPNGMLYNVNGKHAIEIKLKHKKRVIQIGTNDWVNLKAAIEESSRTNVN